MRIQEVSDDYTGHRMAIPVDADQYDDYSDEDEYITEDEESDETGAGIKTRLGHAIASLGPKRIATTLKSTSATMLGKSTAFAKQAGNLGWIVATSLLLVGLPVLYAYDREKNTAAQAGQMLPLDS